MRVPPRPGAALLGPRQELLEMGVDRERSDAAPGVLRQHGPPLPRPLPARAADDDAPLRRRAAQRDDRVADDRAGLERRRSSSRSTPRRSRRTRAMWAPTVLYVVILQRTGDVDWHVVGASYLGVLLVGAGYLSLGLLMSALTKSQFLALVLDGARHPRALHPRHRRVRHARGHADPRRLRARLGVGADERLRQRRRRLAAPRRRRDAHRACRSSSRRASSTRGGGRMRAQPRRSAVSLVGRRGGGRRRGARQRARRAPLHARGLDERQALHAHAADARDAPRARRARADLGPPRRRRSDGAER